MSNPDRDAVRTYRDVHTEIRWTQDERRALSVACRRQGLSLSSYVRQAALNQIADDNRTARGDD